MAFDESHSTELSSGLGVRAIATTPISTQWDRIPSVIECLVFRQEYFQRILRVRTEQIGQCTLYNGDCRDVIPTLKGVDVVCTDPPYGIEDLVGGYGRSGETIANDTNLDACMQALQAASLVATDATWAVFYSPRIRREFMNTTPSNLQDLGEIIWDKKMPGMGRGIRYQHETIAMFYTGKEKDLLGGERNFSVIQHIRDASEHPHQKPKGLIRRLLEMLDGKLVLDPFMGSGTTGVACAELGRAFIGIELDPKHFDTCCRRIEKAYAAPDMFAAPVVEQIGMFANDNLPVTKKRKAATSLPKKEAA